MTRSWLTLALLAVVSHARAGIPLDVEPALLAASVNKHAVEGLGQFWHSGDTLVAEPAEWVRLGIVISSVERAKPSLTAFELGIVPKIDEATGSVELTTPGARLPSKTLGAYDPQRPTLSPAATGLLINYNLAGSLSAGQQDLSAAHEFRMGGRWGVLSSTGEATWSKGQGAGYSRGYTRWQYDDYKRLLTYQAGDLASGGAIMGGVRIAHDPAGLDPLTPTYAMPSIGGLAVDAGTLDVLNNRAKVSSQDVDAGPYQIENFPIRSGRNDLDLVLRDKFGREQSINSQQFYFAPSLLKKGLSTWEVAAGKVRSGKEYGAIGATASGAYGLTNRFTIEVGAQASQDGNNAWVGGRTVLGTVGTLRGRVGVSTGPKGSGQHLELAYDYQGPRIGIQLSHEQSKDYWELASSNTFSLRPTTSTKASINWRNQDNSLGLRVSAVDQTANGLNTRFVEAGAKWNRNANSVDAGVLYDLDAHAPSLSLAFRHSFGSVNTSVAARVAPDVTQYAASVFAATKVKGMPLAVGLNAITDDRGNRSILAHGILVTSNGTVNAGVRQDNGRTTVNASMNGALHIGRGGIDALPYSGDGYAVVSIPGVEGVPVKLNNRVVGKTNKAGDLVIGPLASMVGTHVWIDDRALPAGVSLETSDAIAAPRRLAGALVTFPVRAMDARTFIVTLDGKPISAGSVAKSDQEETQVGFGGELFLEKGKAGQNITITHEKGSCSMKIPTPLPAFGDVVTLACQGK